MLLAISISIAVFMVGVVAVVLVLRRRDAAANAEAEARREHAVLDDCGDDVMWEVGKMRPIVASPEFREMLSKRSFLRRAAFTFSAFCVAWLASRGKSVAFGSMQDGLMGKHDPIKEQNHNDSNAMHVDSNSHTDDHTDGGGGDHADGHSDGGTQHSDTPSSHTDQNN